MKNKVFLQKAIDYKSAAIQIPYILQNIAYKIHPGDNILVKPNLVSWKNSHLSCTNAAIVTSVCKFLLDFGVKITISDSPGFGSVPKIARATGMDQSLKQLGLKVESMKPAVKCKVGQIKIGISRTALESDFILNIPKLKAHAQMYITGAVKNFFGCVNGVRKAVLHAQYGDKGNKFQAAIMDIMLAMPPSVSLLDGVIAMHVSGPIEGQPYNLGCIAMSENCVALDTSIYQALGCQPQQVALWLEAVSRNLPGANPKHLTFPLLNPNDFDVSNFKLPATLKPQTFSPPRLMLSTLRRWKDSLLR